MLVTGFGVYLCSYYLEQEIGSVIFDKDDQLAVEFVTAAANIRAASFGIPMHSLFEAKGIAGNIVHAVATTNAIVAGLIVIETIKLLNKSMENLRSVLDPLVNFFIFQKSRFRARSSRENSEPKTSNIIFGEL